MARTWTRVVGLLLLSGTLCDLALDPSQLQVTTKKTISGVFMVTQNNKYSFNATVAFDVCKALHGNIATKTQVETALQNGLEMCRFGWVEEKVAVAPRIQSNERCGQGKTGLVLWRAAEKSPFDVFCFNDTDTVTTPRTTTARTVTTQRPEGSTPPSRPTALPPLITTLTRRPPLFTSSISRLPLPPSGRPPRSSEAPTEHLPKPTSSSQATDKILHTTTATTTTATTSTTTTTRRPSSSHHSPSATFTSSPSSTLSPPEHTAALAPSQSHQSGRSHFGAPVAIAITLGLLLVLLAAVTAVYYKIKGRSLPFPRLGQEKGVVETEMFKHFRERDLKRHHSVDGERSRKCSSDITLLMEQEAEIKHMYDTTHANHLPSSD